MGTYFNHSKDMTELPASVFTDTSITELNLRDCAVSELPPQLFNMTQLTDLMLAGLPLRQIPEQINQLVNLNRLTVQDCPDLDKLPTTLGGLSNLQYLTLKMSYGNRHELPSDISNLRKLEAIDLEHFKLSEFPDELCDLAQLRVIRIEYSDFKTLPEKLAALTELEQLRLQMGNISDYPKVLFSMPYLKRIDLSFNKISKLPASNRQPIGIRTLELSGNEFTTLPQIDWNAPDLNTLYLNHNRGITDIKKADLSPTIMQLRKLSLSACQLDKFPYALRHMPSLKELVLTSNHIGVIDPPPVEDGFNSLKELQLGGTKLAEFPYCLSYMPALEGLYVSRNAITNLPKPIQGFNNLKFLYLESNQLRHVPDIRKLKRLENLNVADNSIKAIPAVLTNRINKLTYFNVRYNQLNKPLPPDLTERHLEAILKGNPKLSREKKKFPSYVYAQSVPDDTHANPAS